MKKWSVFVVLILSIVLAGCSSDSENSSSADDEFDIKRLIKDFSTREVSAEQASINGKELIVNEEDGSENVYDISNEDFFVSIAPYENQTHPCTFHSLTGCQGEMVEETFNVYVEDEEGNVVIDEEMTTYENGFIDLWLPRDKTYNVKIGHNGKSTEAQISTYEDDATCITTMQLA
ncbi:CueP family metal-binding protein [Jeotgalibacillus malaysiensis]|uniref:CueP family metal-binding protein n=1 Tax=Jeotgalibacillus malaysiensis TaxID=1508404 RepID=UPI00384F252E